MQIVGIAVVVSGVWCVASTPRKTIAVKVDAAEGAGP